MPDTAMAAFYAAFLKAQKAMRDPCKDTTNPHFKSRFVSLKGVADAVRPALQSFGITAFQLIDFEGDAIYVRTVLAHVDGGTVESRCPVVMAKQNDPQAMGSAITYARRYSLAAICGVAPSDDDDDDDGEGAMHREPTKAQAKATKPAPKASPPKAEPFDAPEFACAALDAAKSQQDVDAIVARIMASGFTGFDLSDCKTATKERRAIIAEQE